MEETNLKTCPCCGTKPYSHIETVRNEEISGYISCNNPKCGLKMSFTICGKSKLLNFYDVINAVKEVEERWNRRDGER